MMTCIRKEWLIIFFNLCVPLCLLYDTQCQFLLLLVTQSSTEKTQRTTELFCCYYKVCNRIKRDWNSIIIQIVSMNNIRRKGREANSNIFSSAFERSTVLYPFVLSCHNSLACSDLEFFIPGSDLEFPF